MQLYLHNASEVWLLSDLFALSAGPSIKERIMPRPRLAHWRRTRDEHSCHERTIAQNHAEMCSSRSLIWLLYIVSRCRHSLDESSVNVSIFRWKHSSFILTIRPSVIKRRFRFRVLRAQVIWPRARALCSHVGSPSPASFPVLVIPLCCSVDIVLSMNSPLPPRWSRYSLDFLSTAIQPYSFFFDGTFNYPLSDYWLQGVTCIDVSSGPTLFSLSLSLSLSLSPLCSSCFYFLRLTVLEAMTYLIFVTNWE